MGRKSLATERTNEILDAFERCILKYGLEGTSLSQIAEEAGVKRPIIRHYIGNRDDVIVAMITRVMQSYEQEMADLFYWKRGDSWLPVLLDDLFAAGNDREINHNRIIGEVLVSGAERYPTAVAQFLSVYRQLIQQVADGLHKLYPHQSANRCHETAYALFALASGHADISFAGIGAEYVHMARAVAERLIAELAQS